MTPQISIPHSYQPNRITQSPAERLKKCYDMASPGFLYDLHQEVNGIIGRLQPSDVAMHVGCGYGRIIPELARSAKFVFGIDSSRDHIRYGRGWLKNIHNSLILEMNAGEISFADCFFNKIICLQSSLSFFHKNPETIIKECLRVATDDGEIIIATYSEKYWDELLGWYEIKSKNGLIEEIDYEKTKPGHLVCRDGSSYVTITRDLCMKWAMHFKAHMKTEQITDHCTFVILNK
jgi:SAM-dependent methyltransferase